MNEPEKNSNQGTLYLVATPIGNLGDISQRACQVLEEVEVVACEDTRRTGKLLELLGLQAKKLLIANEHTESSIGPTVVELLAQGKDVALVSDAGTPAISDPGERLVKHVVASEHHVSVVPGPSAVIAAVTLSGFATKRWTMEGFLPRKGRERRVQLKAIGLADRTTVIFESPKRLRKTLAELAAACGPDRDAVVMRELTKLHEEIVRGTLAELCERFSVDVKGETVIVISAAEVQEVSDETIINALEGELAKGTKTSGAVTQVSAALGVQRNRVYSLAHQKLEQGLN